MNCAKIIGYGHYLPDRIMSNDELSGTIDTSNEWIVSRTGIKQRHIASDMENTSDLATFALRDALNNSKLKVDDLDGIIVATTTPDLFIPSTAVIVQHKIGLSSGFAFDIQAVCSGFIYALNIAYSMIKSGQAKTIAVIGAEVMSRIIDWKDRNTCILFGDGAGAIILNQSSIDDNGIIGIDISSDGNLIDILKTKGGISSGMLDSKLEMNGKEVFKFAVEKMISSIISIISKYNIRIEELDWIVPHQANARIISALSERIDFDYSKIAMTVDKHANTSAASIPIALSFYIKNGLIKNGDTVALTSVGAGMTWGAGLIKI